MTEVWMGTLMAILQDHLLRVCSMLGIEAHRQRQVGLSEFKANFSYIVSAKTARAP